MPNKNKENRKEIKRVPRPMGTTYKAYTYHQEPNNNKKKELKRKLQQHIIDIYMNNGMRLNNKQTSIEELSQLIDEDTNTTMLRMNKTIGRIGKIMERENGGLAGFARAIFSGLIFSAMENRALASNQAHMLIAKQGGKYVPFHTSETNKAIANLIGANKPLIDMLSMLTKAGGNASNPLDTGSTGDKIPTEQKALTVESAVALLNQNTKSILMDNDALEAEYLELGTVPEVRAQFQNLASIGIKNSSSFIAENDAQKAANFTPNEVLDEDDFNA